MNNLTPTQQRAVNKALNIIAELRPVTKALTSSQSTKDYLQLQLAAEKSEVFAMIFLDNQHQTIAFEKIFFGTIDGAAVYPREIVRKVIEHNAAAVILTHNHPSGIPEPSQADIAITRKIKSALDTIDVRVLDHIVVGSQGTVSLAERGLM